MPISEASRANLYTGLAEAIGPDRAETLMAQLPRFDPAEVATKSDLAELRSATKSDLAELRSATKSDLAELRSATKSDLAELRSATKSDLTELRTELRDGLAAVNQRLDRLFLTLLVGSFGIVATMLGVIVTVAG